MAYTTTAELLNFAEKDICNLLLWYVTLQYIVNIQRLKKCASRVDPDFQGHLRSSEPAQIDRLSDL